MLLNIRWNRKRNLLMAVVCLLVVLCISGCSSKAGKSHITLKEITDQLTVDFINVGKGDCMVLQTDNYNIMIDTGYEDTAYQVIDKIHGMGIKSIDVLIITHFDKDHIGGAKDILENMDVKQIYMPEYEDSGNKYAKFMEYLNEKGKMSIVTYLTKDIRLTVDHTTFDLYAPKETGYKQENNYSIITKVTNGEDTFLFSGDAEKKRLEEVLGNSMLDCDVLKLPHHGGYEKNIVQFIQEVSPKYAVITCGNPSDVAPEVTGELEYLQSQVYFNCEGDIHIESDSKGNIKVVQKANH